MCIKEFSNILLKEISLSLAYYNNVLNKYNDKDCVPFRELVIRVKGIIDSLRGFEYLITNLLDSMG